jgi:hypothetical protein
VRAELHELTRQERPSMGQERTELRQGGGEGPQDDKKIEA